jgi:6-pyruvoyltetrahydropterin/6-carboxytetrahydropterin synthase
MYELTVRDTFSAAHALRDYDGDCANMHGHNWSVDMVVRAETLGPNGLAADFRDLKSVLHDVLSELDHKLINEVVPFDEINPSSEHIAKWLFERMSAVVEGFGVRLAAIRVGENENCSVSYYEDV